MLTEQNAKFLILWDNGNMEYTNDVPAKLGKLVRCDYPSHSLPNLVKYDVYENGTLRNLHKYDYGMKR